MSTAAVPSESAGFENPLHDPVMRRLSIVVILGTIMSILDTTIVNVAIETISRDLHSRLSTIQWVTTGYLLALAIVIPLSGWVVERFGAKETWLVSLVLFTAGSALCGVAWSPGSLIVFRIIQGLGGGMIMPIGQTILARAAGPQRMGRVMSLIGVPALIAPVIGPVLGGLIVDSLSWRWIFFVNLPIGVVALILSIRYLARNERQNAGKLDVLGVALLSPGLALFVYGLSEAGTGSGFGSATVVGCLAGGAVLIVAFVLHALRIDRPLLDMALFKDRGFAMANVVTFVFGAVLYGAMFLIPLYYQLVRGESPLTAGLLLAPQGVGAMIVMPLGGRLSDRIGPGKVVPIGMVVLLIGSFAYSALGASTSYAWLALSLFVRGLGMGWVMMPSMSAAYLNLTRALVPRATTTINILMRVGGSVGTALVAVELQRQIAARLPRLANILSNTAPTTAARLPQPVAQKLAESFNYSFWIVIGVTVLGVVGSVFLPKGRPSPVLESRSTEGAEAGADRARSADELQPATD